MFISKQTESNKTISDANFLNCVLIIYNLIKNKQIKIPENPN